MSSKITCKLGLRLKDVPRSYRQAIVTGQRRLARIITAASDGTISATRLRYSASSAFWPCLQQLPLPQLLMHATQARNITMPIFQHQQHLTRTHRRSRRSSRHMRLISTAQGCVHLQLLLHQLSPCHRRPILHHRHHRHPDYLRRLCRCRMRRSFGRSTSTTTAIGMVTEHRSR